MDEIITNHQKREDYLNYQSKYNQKRKQYKLAFTEKDIVISNALDKAITESNQTTNTFLKRIIVDFLKNNGYLPL